MSGGVYIAASILLMSPVSHASDLDALAEAIYFESRSEVLACQIVVAQSIINRVHQERFPNTIEEVVHQKSWSKRYQDEVCQYSYFCDGKPDIMTNYKAELISYRVASMVLNDNIPDISNGADHYHADYSHPYWGPDLTDTFTCGTHVFGKLKW